MNQKILWIHGRWTDVNSIFRSNMKEAFLNHNLELVLPQFPCSFDPSYAEWEEIYKTIDFTKYNTVFTNSLWWIMTIRYLFENNIQVNNLVLTVPWLSFSTMRWEKPNVFEVFRSLENKDISIVSKNSIIISVLNDEVVPFSSWEELSNRLNSKFILLNKWKHKLEWHNDYLAQIISNL